MVRPPQRWVATFKTSYLIMYRRTTRPSLHITSALCLTLISCKGSDPAPDEKDPRETTSGEDSATDTTQGDDSDGQTTTTSGDDSGSSTDSSTKLVPVEDLPKIPLRISNPDDTAISNAPFTFGHPFHPGVYKGDLDFELRVPGRNTPIALQMDTKALHPDKSLRHVIFSGQTGALGPKEVLEAKLTAKRKSPSAASIDKQKVLSSTQDLKVTLTLKGVNYSLSMHELLAAAPEKVWLDGPEAKEWQVAGSFKDESGKEHPHLYGIFDLRVYGDAAFAMVDFVLENNWTYEAKPSNLLYDVSIKAGDKTLYTQEKLYHLRRARWKKKFWLGDSPQVHIAHDPATVMATRAVPNYDPGLIGNISPKLLDNYAKRWKPTTDTKALDDKGDRTKVGEGHFEFSYDNYGPMGTGLAQAQMGTTGGRPDIGPMPRWVASYFLNQDPISKKVALGMADLAGTWPMHYRDKKTGRIVSLDDYPYISTIWNQQTTHNPATGKKEGPAPCEATPKTHCGGYHTPDTAHQPAFNYIPYLLTGDRFYLEELHFWTNFNFINQNPGYRGLEKGLYTSLQDRGQAWSMRTLGYTVYITPDDHPLKSYFSKKLTHNLERYHEKYIVTPPNGYGALIPNYSFPSSSPWMDDFFTWAMGNLVDLGFEAAEPIFKWKSKFPVQRMGFGTPEAKNYCWILGSAYHLRIGEAKGEPMYQSIDIVYAKNNGVEDHNGDINIDDKGLPCASQEQADAKGIQFEEMIGYGRAPAGFPSNMRPALAVAANSGIEGAKEAWKRFIERKAKPKYEEYPVWAIVPRSYQP